MTAYPKFKLSRLREIGWAKWDPIGLGGLCERPENEYDGYLLQAAQRLWNGASKEEVANYFISVETVHMGLGESLDAHRRADEVADALSDYVDELRD